MEEAQAHRYSTLVVEIEPDIFGAQQPREVDLRSPERTTAVSSPWTPVNTPIAQSKSRVTNNDMTYSPSEKDPVPTDAHDTNQGSKPRQQYSQHQNALLFRLRIVDRLSRPEAAETATTASLGHPAITGRTKQAITAHIEIQDSKKWKKYITEYRTGEDYAGIWPHAEIALLYKVRCMDNVTIKETAREYRRMTNNKRTSRALWVYIYSMDCDEWKPWADQYAHHSVDARYKKMAEIIADLPKVSAAGDTSGVHA